MRANSAVWALLRGKSASSAQAAGPGAVLSRGGGWLQPKFRFCTPDKCRDVLGLHLLWPENGLAGRGARASSSGQAASVLRCPGPRKQARVGAQQDPARPNPPPLDAHVQPCAQCPPHQPEGTRAPALGPPVRVIGDAPAQKSYLGGTMPAKEEPWHLSEHRQRTGHC